MAAVTPNLRPGAVTLGVVIDTVGSMISGVAILVVAAIAVVVSGGRIDEGTLDLWFNAPWFLSLALATGAAWSLAGGYVAARMAGFGHVRHALWAGGLSLFLVLLLEIPGDSSGTPFWYKVLGWSLVLPMAFCGGVLARKPSGASATATQARDPLR